MICVGLAAAPAGAMAQGTVPATELPTYQTRRFDEDWSVLRGREPRDAFDRIKYLPLNGDGSWWIGFGAQLRERVEGWSDFNFGAPKSADHDDIALHHRLFAHLDLHLGEHLRLFVEGKNAEVWDRDLVGGRRTTDVDEADLENALAEVRSGRPGEQTFLRAGRQELLFGKQRLVSPLDWPNVRRTFEGLSAAVERAGWSLTGFAVHPVPVEKYDFNEADDDTDFFGLYATRKPAVPSGTGLDVYWMQLQREQASLNGTAGEEDRGTVGGRLWGKLAASHLDYDVESAIQFGELGGEDIEAWMLGSQIGWKLGTGPAAPRIYAGLDYGSGDEEAGGDAGTFNQLFPLGHEYLGYVDAIGRQNVLAFSAGASFAPADKLGADLRAHHFRRADDGDGLYNAGGGLGFGPGGSDEKEIGHELDVTLRYQRDRHTLIQAGYSHFFAGPYLDDVSPGEDVDFVYLMLQYTF